MQINKHFGNVINVTFIWMTCNPKTNMNKAIQSEKK